MRLLEERVDAALAGAGRADSAVVLVGHGPDEPQANAETVKVARMLWEGRGFGLVEPAFVQAGPSVEAALERCRRLGAERAVVVPYSLFTPLGPMPTSGLADVRAAAPVGDCDGLADLVLERYAEVLDGDLRSNCNSCFYRPKFTAHAH
nr:CbiX/SirB N-terminal domain-containing protein [Motilibacter aurantiacus]